MARTEEMHAQHPINRRTFLMNATGCVAVPWLVSTASAAPLPVIQVAPRCRVGFIDHHHSAISRNQDIAAARQWEIPAEQITHGDSRLNAQGVRLHFRGIHFADDRASCDLHSLTLDLEMQVDGAAADSIPWHLWTYSNREVLNVSGDVHARVPLRDDGSLLFTVTTHSESQSPSAHSIKLTTGSDRGVPKLRLGTYVIAVPNDDCEGEERSFSVSRAYLTFTIADVNQTVSDFA
jgi:hypothetical protein